MTQNENGQKALGIIRNAYDKLMGRQFFYFNIASQFALKESPSKEVCPTMGVAHVDGVHWLIYNPDFIKYYDYNEISTILEHEICHFTYDHVKHFDTSNNGRKVFKNEGEARDYIRDKEKQSFIHRAKNIATDRSINVHLFNLPNIRMSLGDIKADFTDKEGKFNKQAYEKSIAEKLAKNDLWFKDPNMTIERASDDTILEASCITENSFNKILVEAGYKGDISQVKRYGTWKYFFDILMSCPKTEEALKDIQDMDVHFGDDPGEDGEGGRDSQEAREKIMIEAARNSNPHDIPGSMREYIRHLIDKHSKETALPWNVILRRMVNSAKKSIKRNDINSRNRYAPGRQILPGYRLDPIKDICLIWDVSGSCTDNETQATFIKECNSMIKAGSVIKVLYTDAGVEHEQVCDKGKPLKPAQYEITGGGGTDMDPAIRQAIKEGYRIIINLTDCYVPYNMSRKEFKGRKIITVSTTDSEAPKHYGPTIKVSRG